MDTASTGRDLVPGPGFFFFSAVTVLLILVLALVFIHSNKIDSFLFPYWQIHACALGMVLGQAGLASSAGLVSNCPVSWQEITLL